MNDAKKFLFISAMCPIILGACAQHSMNQIPSSTTTPNNPIGMPNPASEYCVKQGGKSEIKRQTDSSEYGVCHLPNGKTIGEWELYRHDHGAFWLQMTKSWQVVWLGEAINKVLSKRKLCHSRESGNPVTNLTDCFYWFWLLSRLVSSQGKSFDLPFLLHFYGMMMCGGFLTGFIEMPWRRFKC